jgi:hypothetical protein
MTWTKRLIATAALLMFVGAPLQAEARFGKSSSSNKSSGSSSSSSKSSSSSSDSSSSHKAVSVSAPSAPSYSEPNRGHHRPSYRHDDHRRGRHGHSHRVAYRPRYRHVHYHYGWGFGYHPFYYAATPAPNTAPATASAGAPAAEVKTGPTATVGIDAHGHGLGATVGAGLAIEGKRWGINGNFATAFYSIDGAKALDPEGTHIYDVHLTYALISGTHGRLRLEAGINGIVAPDLSVLGPDAGTSLALGLIGPIGFEASAHVTPLPHRRYDYNLGLTLTLGHVGLRAGWKELWMDDNELLEEGVHNADTFRGPYFGVGFAF